MPGWTEPAPELTHQKSPCVASATGRPCGNTAAHYLRRKGICSVRVGRRRGPREVANDDPRRIGNKAARTRVERRNGVQRSTIACYGLCLLVVNLRLESTGHRSAPLGDHQTVLIRSVPNISLKVATPSSLPESIARSDICSALPAALRSP